MIFNVKTMLFCDRHCYVRYITIVDNKKNNRSIISCIDRYIYSIYDISIDFTDAYINKLVIRTGVESQW